MELCRRLFSPLPLSSPPPSLLVLSKEGGVSVELLSGRERQSAMEDIFSLCGTIGGDEQVGISLSDAVGAVDKFVSSVKGGSGSGQKAGDSKGAEKKEEKDSKRSTAGFRRSQLGKLF